MGSQAKLGISLAVVAIGLGGCGNGGGPQHAAQTPDIPTVLGRPLQSVSIYQVVYGAPSSQTLALAQAASQLGNATYTVVSKPIAQVRVAAAHVVGSRTHWTIQVAPVTPSTVLTSAYNTGEQFVADVDGLAARMLYVQDAQGGYAFVMGDHLQAAQSAARTWTTQVTTTDRGA